MVATCPHAPRASLRSRVGRAVFHWPRLCAADRNTVEGFPWPGSLAGGRRSGAAPLTCLWPLRFSVLERRRKVISARSCVKARPRCARCCAAADTARSDWLPRRDGLACNDQPRIGQGRSARFSPPPLETQRPWEAQPPLRVAATHSPQKNASNEDCFFVWQIQHPRR